jgi:hypothetical protein
MASTSATHDDTHPGLSQRSPTSLSQRGSAPRGNKLAPIVKNPAAARTATAEALSGLSRAFFHAGARALLVSHRTVNSDATVKLITKTVSTMAADTPVVWSEALRPVNGRAHSRAYLAYWAPSVVVGEEAAGVAAALNSHLRPSQRQPLNEVGASSWPHANTSGHRRTIYSATTNKKATCQGEPIIDGDEKAREHRHTAPRVKISNCEDRAGMRNPSHGRTNHHPP